MSGPKHLWSGDWENESEEATTQIVRQPRPRDPEPAAPAPTPPPQPRRRRARPWVVPVAIAAIVIAGAAYGLTKVFGSSTPLSRSTATISPLSPPTSRGSTRPVRWLGMEIITAPPGMALVETVQPNSNGDRAGLEPGDAILLINNHPVGTSGSIASAIKGLHSGDHATVEVNTGGTILQLVATLAAPPTPYP